MWISGSQPTVASTLGAFDLDRLMRVARPYGFEVRMQRDCYHQRELPKKAIIHGPSSSF